MADGNAQDEEENKKGPDLFASLPGYQPFQQDPVWPGQKPAPQASAPQEDQPQPADPDAAPMLKLPSKPKANRGHNLDVGRMQQLANERQAQFQAQIQAEVAAQMHAEKLAQQQAQNPQQPQQIQPQQIQPGQIQQPQPQPQQIQPQQPQPQPQQQQHYNPGQIQPGFTPPHQPDTHIDTGGFVPTDPGAIVRPNKPVVTSASAKPDWTQPQWPQAKPAEGQQPPGIPNVSRPAGGGSLLPPAIAPIPQAPYSQAPPTLGESPQPGMKQLPFTIKRDLSLSKELFGDQAAGQPAEGQHHEYTQTDFIPQSATVRVLGPDPDRPWTPAPAKQYEFFEEQQQQQQQPQINPQNAIHGFTGTGQPAQDIQFARGFNPENPLGFDQDNQPDPRYSPFQNEVAGDILKQSAPRYAADEDVVPQEKRERGAAALRALNRNADKYYENQNLQQNQPQDELPPVVRLTSRDLFGLATYYCILTKEVLTSPAAFFNNMSLAGGLNDPLIYLAFTSIMTGLFSAIAHLNPLFFISTTIFSFLSVAVGSIVVQLVFKKMGGDGKFEQTFNVLSFSRATFIFAWISLGPFPIGGILAGLYTAYLNYIGLNRVHKLPPATTGVIIAIFTAIPFLIGRMFSIK